MQLTMENLQQQHAFCGPAVERSIRWQQGEKTLEASVFIRPLSYHHAVGDAQALRDNGDLLAARIAASVVDGEGRPVFTPGDITGTADPARGPLNAELTHALLVAIGEVNNLDKLAKKPNRSAT